MIIAITENAQGAHWAQATLDTIWAFLERIQDHPADKIYEEDQKIEDEKLKQRMKRLALQIRFMHPTVRWFLKLQGILTG